MDPRVKPVPFSTRDILLDLFKLSLKDRGLPELHERALVTLDTQIARIDNSLQDYIAQSPQIELNAIKALLAEAKDSPKRKELIQNITDLDNQLINLNIQGINLSTESKKLVNRFWDLIIKATLNKTTIVPMALNQIKVDLENLTVKAEPFIETHKIIQKQADDLALKAEAMVGKALSEVKPQPSPTIAGPATAPPGSNEPR